MLETANIRDMKQHYARAHQLRAQAFADLFTFRWAREKLKKRAAKQRPVSNTCPC